MYFSSVYHALGLINVLKHRMSCVYKVTQIKSKNGKHLDEEQVYNYVVDTVKMHDKTIQYIDLVQSSYAQSLFGSCSTSMLNISAGSIILSMSLTNPLNMINMMIFWSGYICDLFYVSWPGQKLLDNYDELFTSIYFCGWYNFSSKTKFLINFMLMRCSISCQLKAGPFIKINFQTCGRILQRSLSYFTVVVSLNKNSN
ncbi:uncharacterized protein LOC106646159 [Copidosoma floridanum]|uniref:uncharacterized protein LOC106646159 n=1 Tax=Copidosoma floridanum TaxID=29053 RepID=UPI0006C9A20F|nr:uncharacterized protein LOC106646159 [Copidosoma floridanum]